MSAETYIVDNRIFLLGLDDLYRKAMKQHERQELLLCARRVAASLQVQPADVPVEGYYTEHPKLTEYFLLMRALQNVGQEQMPVVASLPEFQRLVEVTSAPLFGKATSRDTLLPSRRDALSQALLDTPMSEWSVERLTETAYTAAQKADDFSLVGLAALVRDALVLTATRESVVLYAWRVAGAAKHQPPPPKFIWQVDKELAEQARRFIDAFAALFGDQLPAPEEAQAARYWYAAKHADIVGRCVRIGINDAMSPILNYHWAICLGSDASPKVQEFWHEELWTTDRYRSEGYDRWCIKIS